MYKGSITFSTPMLYAFGFIGLFTMGGLTGLFLAALGIDVHVTDTYFVVAHFHYIMVGGAVMGYLGGMHFWWPKISGRMYPESLGRLAALIVFLGFNLTFFPQFILGYLGMPRRYWQYPPEFQVLNVLSTAGSTILAVGYLLPMVYFLWSMRYGKVAPDNPWGASGLEWKTTSPPPTFNFDEPPVVDLGSLRLRAHSRSAGGAQWRIARSRSNITIRRSSTTSPTWSSSARLRRWACGCFWRPKSCSSAACSAPTSSIVSGISPTSPPPATRSTSRWARSTPPSSSAAA